MAGANILFILSGSIACYKACDAISRLVQRGYRVRTVATEAALRFVGTATLEGLTGEKAATGLFELAGALLLAHEWTKPLLIAPAMNPEMWSHPATVASVQKLKTWGARFVPVGEGRTACGEVGEGRLAEPDAIVAAIEAALVRPARCLRVLGTSGGTARS